MTEGFISWRACLDQIFTLKELSEKAREKKRRLHVNFMDLEKAYDKVNREALWKVLTMYDVSCKHLVRIRSM